MIAVHCVWVDAEEIDLLAAGRVGVIRCPRSNLKPASGIAPVPDMLWAGVPLGLGTDGAASKNKLDLLAEIQTATLIHKGFRLDPSAVPAVAVLQMPTIRAARTLKLDHLTVSLERGKRGDLVVLDLEVDNLVPMYNPVSHLAYAAAAADVRTVLIDGQIVHGEGKAPHARRAGGPPSGVALAATIGPLRGTRH
jgi:5-methylthioadenosine/S-adenosylhomocysteine deaminase